MIVYTGFSHGIPTQGRTLLAHTLTLVKTIAIHGPFVSHS